MKKLLAASFLLMACYTLSAQDQPDLEKLRPKRFIDKVEIMAGSSLCYPLGSNYLTQNGSTKLGYSIGLNLQHRISSKLDLWLKIIYDSKTISSSQSFYNDSSYLAKTEINYNNNYLKLCLTPSFLVSKKFSVFAGVYYSWLLNTGGYQSAVMNNQSNKSYAYWTQAKYLNIPNDAGLVIGISRSINLFSRISSIQLSTDYSLVKVNNWSQTSIRPLTIYLSITAAITNSI